MRPERLRLEAGAAAVVRLTLDPGLSGGISKLVLAKVENAEGLDRLLTVNGTVRSKAPQEKRQETECEWCKKLSVELRKQAYDSWRMREGVLHYYYSADCRTCTDFLDREIPRVQKTVGRTIEVDRQDIRDTGVLDELDAVLAGLKQELRALAGPGDRRHRAAGRGGDQGTVREGAAGRVRPVNARQVQRRGATRSVSTGW